jgi:hypothetical protein
MPNKHNPMGNFLPFDNRDRPAVCDTPMTEHYKYLNKNDNFDNTFRLNFNPNAVTTSYPDTTGLAHFLFSNPARCRDTGYLCRTDAGETRNLDRMGFNPQDKYYQEINNNYNKSNIYYIGGHTN